MLDGEIKRKINSARQILVGKVPDPKSQVEQITNALIYKFMDDMDLENEELGLKPQFFIEDYAKYSWRKLLDNQLNSQQRLNLYTEALGKISSAKHIPQLFRDIFKDAFLTFRDPKTLNLFLKEIDGFSYDNSESLGNAFEYLLSIMSSQGDAGQFRTPRHIIDFIVEAVNPQKNETILDPACGTAGFLISSYKHIIKNNSSAYRNKSAINEDNTTNAETAADAIIVENKSYSGDLLTPAEKERLMENIKGYDISPDMVKLALVNMYLHGFKNPQILVYDTLSNDQKWDENFDVILANPPFMSPKGGIVPHSNYMIKAKRAEVLFVDYIAEHLNINGRAGIIVPEGIIFQSARAYKSLRKNLIQDWGLFAVVSLPSGVFQPYSGVKTSILLLDKRLAKKTDKILFVKINNDGFDLGAQRRKIDKNDLPEALKIIKKWKNELKIDENQNIAFAIEKKKIAENGDYNLTANRYREVVDYTNVKWPMVELGEVLNYEQPTKYIVESTNYKEEYEIPVLTAGKSFLLGYTNEKYGVFPSEKLPVIIFDDFTTSTKLVDFPFKVKSSAMKILKAKENANIKFVFYIMQKIKFDATQHKRYWISQYSKIKIPLPPLEVQEQIVKEIEQYQKVIDGAKQVVENWKPSFRIDPDWPMVELGEVCKTASGGTPLKSRVEYYQNGSIPWLRSGEVAQGEIYKSEFFITKQGLKNSSAKLFPKNTVLVAMYGATAGQVGLLKIKAATNQAICGILPNTKFVPEFLYLVLKKQRDTMVKSAGGGAQPNISQTIIRNLTVPLPPLEVQEQIVKEIEEEQKIVEANKKLIEKMQKKIDKKIGEVWGEEI